MSLDTPRPNDPTEPMAGEATTAVESIFNARGRHLPSVSGLIGLVIAAYSFQDLLRRTSATYLNNAPFLRYNKLFMKPLARLLSSIN